MNRLLLTVLLYAIGVATVPQQAKDATIKTLSDDALNATDGRYRLEPQSPTAPETATSAFEDDEFIRNVRQEEFTTEPDDVESTTATPETTTTAKARRLTSPATTPPRTYTGPSPRFISKLSYFNRATDSSGVLANTVEKSGKSNKRKYKSRCRCEKIWNCPKLQITVPRCPEEYFLCCF